MDPFYWFKRHEISRGISYRAALQPPLLSSLASGVKKKKKTEFAVKFRFATWFVFFYFFVLFLFLLPLLPPFFRWRYVSRIREPMVLLKIDEYRV